VVSGSQLSIVSSFSFRAPPRNALPVRLCLAVFTTHHSPSPNHEPLDHLQDPEQQHEGRHEAGHNN